MNVPQLVLHHQRLEQRITSLRLQIERLEARLMGDPRVETLRGRLAELTASRRDLDLRLRDRDRQVEGQRSRLKSRERELMSGRIGNPTELMKLSQEVDHLKAAVTDEEDRELELMEEAERLESDQARLEADLRSAEEAGVQATPALRSELERGRAELGETEAERDAVWQSLPAAWQAEYRRLRDRLPNPAAEVVGGQCQACHVGVTSSGMQVLRRGGLLLCENCGRLLVVA